MNCQAALRGFVSESGQTGAVSL